MAKELPWFKFDCDEWLTGDVTLEELDIQGLFISICAYYWKQNCNTTITKLKKRYKCATSFHWDTLIDSNIIKINNDVVTINFLDEQWEEMDKDRIKKAIAGKKGAEKRWKKQGLNSTTNGSAIKVPMAKHGNIEVDKEIEIEIEEDNTLRLKAVEVGVILSQFEEFWDKYDKKVDKTKCEKKFFKLKQSEMVAILETVEAYVKAHPEKQFRKNPLTYLNGQCWLDPIEDFKQEDKKQIEVQSMPHLQDPKEVSKMLGFED